MYRHCMCVFSCPPFSAHVCARKQSTDNTRALRPHMWHAVLSMRLLESPGNFVKCLRPTVAAGRERHACVGINQLDAERLDVPVLLASVELELKWSCIGTC